MPAKSAGWNGITVQNIFHRPQLSPKFLPEPAGFCMKLLVFAHTPPPHHGQSYMVKLMLDGFGGDARKTKSGGPSPFGIECYHVNARFSKTLKDVGEFQGTKIFLILRFCLQAIWCRFRYGVTHFYYVPAPGKNVALYRDWLVMLLCRPFFKRVILHWHAAGLAKWLETSVQIRSRAITYRLFKPVDLSIVLSRYNVADAEKLLSSHIHVVSNGIPDPCPEFMAAILPQRQARSAARVKLLNGETLDTTESARAGDDPHVIKILFLAHCTREKGLFAALDGVRGANRILASGNSPLRFRLLVAGNFMSAAENTEFNQRLTDPELAGAIQVLGFVSAANKERALREADGFCFPTRYLGENQPVNLIEAMAFGLPIVTTRWRSLPEMLPPDYPGLINNQDAGEVADALLKMARRDDSRQLRELFLNRFSVEQYLTSLGKALHSIESP
ncbi:MAG: glycosyltransferase family 4 protein [Limisphaerales bacterium]